MKKAYWIARVDVTDLEAYKKYAAANQTAFKKYGAKYLVRGGAFEAPEGVARGRNVVIEFPSYADALACWNSPEYKEAAAFRKGASEAEIIIIEGYDGAQP
jgi:uncharacterized protein (DUF1330 family)